ncbi:uncharacterized protein LOC142530214 [Primulina tabacum]|uniref:uncharacterized protein LOC142530214 n=1 Tax=Primulina tabacum TaxID=48773 RepID=UPI003F5A7956
MLVAHEMSKKVDSRRSPPNVIAKLMGLETLPRQETDSYMQKNHCRNHPRCHSNIQVNCWEQQIEFFHHMEPNECKDVYEILQNSPHKGRYDRTTDDKKMALIRQKFTEAKRLSMDEKLRQSKQFQGTLEVLNANKNLFLQCLQEPNSMISQNIYNLRSIPPPPGTKRITILRPSKLADSNNFARSWNKVGKEIKKGSFVLNGLEKGLLVNSSPVSWNNFENSPQPTQIVVLKPSSLKSLDVKVVGSPHSQSRRVINGEDLFGDIEEGKNEASKEVAKAMTQQMLKKIGRHHRDEALTSSMLSNAYVGDESSFNKSEMEYSTANLSESEVMSPVSRHSWDYINRNGSPYSSSSFSRVFYSPESSVCREAKKRLSERWAMMESNESCLKQRLERRSSNTLGEMLALSEKKAPVHVEVANLNKEPMDSNSFIGSEFRTNENLDNSPKNLVRSKSVPVSSSKYGTGLNTDVSFPDKVQREVPEEDTKERNVKSSFKLKVSRLFFSRNKKSHKDESLLSEIKDELHSSVIDCGQIDTHISAGLSNLGSEHFSRNLPEPSNVAYFSNQVGKLGTLLPETGLSTRNPTTFGKPSENLDQPSPISVLDRPFEDDQHSATTFPHYVKPDQQGFKSPVNLVRSNLIDKSPPIGSIARTLTWDDSCMDMASSYSPNQSSTSQGTDDEKQEWFSFVKTLLSAANVQGMMQFYTSTTKWHSSESPLDPSLRDKYVDLQDPDIMCEAKRRQKRSTRKRVFDYVNATLVEIAEYGSVSGQSSTLSIKADYNLLDDASYTVLDEVWARMNAWFSCEVKCMSDNSGDEYDLFLKRVVRKEVVGKWWIDRFRLESDNFGHEIEAKLLEELLQEAVAEL